MNKIPRRLLAGLSTMALLSVLVVSSPFTIATHAAGEVRAFDDNVWESLTDEQQRTAIQELVDFTAEKLKISAPDLAEENLDASVVAHYVADIDSIVLNSASSDTTGSLMADTIIHEMRHAYQYAHIDDGTPETKAWKENDENYISMDEDYAQYLMQPLEADAIAYVAQFEEEYGDPTKLRFSVGAEIPIDNGPVIVSPDEDAPAVMIHPAVVEDGSTTRVDTDENGEEKLTENTQLNGGTPIVDQETVQLHLNKQDNSLRTSIEDDNMALKEAPETAAVKYSAIQQADTDMQIEILNRAMSLTNGDRPHIYPYQILGYVVSAVCFVGAVLLTTFSKKHANGIAGDKRFLQQYKQIKKRQISFTIDRFEELKMERHEKTPFNC